MTKPQAAQRPLIKALLTMGLMAAASVWLGGCVSATVDEMTFMEPTGGIGDSSVVILGRRHRDPHHRSLSQSYWSQ